MSDSSNAVGKSIILRAAEDRCRMASWSDRPGGGFVTESMVFGDNGPKCR